MAADPSADAGHRGEQRRPAGAPRHARTGDHAWAGWLATELERYGSPVEVEFPEEPHAAAQRLLAFLGVTWTVKPVTTSLLARLQAEEAAAAAAKPKPEPERKGPATRGTARAKELREIDQARIDLQPAISRCGLNGCGWSFDGTVGEGRELARQHREQAHPGVRSLTKGERKMKEIEESRRLRAERDAQQRGIRALERMDAGEPQEPDKIGEGGPGANGNGAAALTAAAGRADGPHDRADDEVAASTSSPSPKTKHTLDSILQAVRDYAADHDGYGPPGSKPPFAGMAIAAKNRFGRTWRQIAAEAGVKPALMGSAAHKAKKTAQPPAEPNVPEPVAELEDVPDPGGASTDLEVTPPASGLRDPIRTAEIPYDADVLEDEARYLRRRASALEQIAGGLRTLAALTTTQED